MKCYREQTIEPIEASDIMHVEKVSRRPIFIKIANVLDLHFQGQRFESSSLHLNQFTNEYLEEATNYHHLVQKS